MRSHSGRNNSSCSISFITFSSVPIYTVYGNAAEVFGWSALSDQTVAGIIMKLGGGLLIWTTIAVIWSRWAKEEKEWDVLEYAATKNEVT